MENNMKYNEIEKYDLIESGIFMFMKEIQEKKSLTIQALSDFLNDLNKLSKKNDDATINYKLSRIKRNWMVLVDFYEKNDDIKKTEMELAILKLITEHFANTLILDTDKLVFQNNIEETKLEEKYNNVHECINYFLELINEKDYAKINASLDRFKELENDLALFEVTVIDNLNDELEQKQKLWNVFHDLYKSGDANDVFVSEQIKIIAEMFENILTVNENLCNINVNENLCNINLEEIDKIIELFEKYIKESKREGKVAQRRSYKITYTIDDSIHETDAIKLQYVPYDFYSSFGVRYISEDGKNLFNKRQERMRAILDDFKIKTYRIWDICYDMVSKDLYDIEKLNKEYDFIYFRLLDCLEKANENQKEEIQLRIIKLNALRNIYEPKKSVS